MAFQLHFPNQKNLNLVTLHERSECSDFIRRHWTTLLWYAFMKSLTSFAEAFARGKRHVMSPNDTDGTLIAPSRSIVKVYCKVTTYSLYSFEIRRDVTSGRLRTSLRVTIRLACFAEIPYTT